MADSSLSSDMEHESSPSRAQKRQPAPQGSKGRSRSKSSRAQPASSKRPATANKDAQRHHKALERQFDIVRCKTLTDTPTASAMNPVPSDQPDVETTYHHGFTALQAGTGEGRNAHLPSTLGLSKGVS